MKRLYVGGLGHAVTDKDLRDRFGKFGTVEDVELKTRTDEQGVPFKTFGYINIVISDSDLKKCQSVLNKSQWKGGTLQIETAKQSFLQRLSEEREEAARFLCSPPEASSQQQILDSLRDAGVSNFTMKSAVPGTEIPGHKDWVVGKFGRVLPVMQLHCCRGNKARTMKYDPSKYGHNLRVLAPPTEAPPTPVSKLTWSVEGGDDEMSRKRRGEFPPFTPKRRKTRPSSTLIGSSNGPARPIRALSPPLNSESDEELRRIVRTSHDALEPEDEALEVVPTGFIHTRRKDEEERDSGDTDELFSSRNKHQSEQSNTSADKKQRKVKTKRSKYDSTDEETEEESLKKKELRKVKKCKAKTEESTERKRKGEEDRKQKLNKQNKEEKRAENKTTEETNDEEEESDSDYAALFSNVTRLELSLSDLRALAEKHAPEDQTTAPTILSVKERVTGKGTTPEEILEEKHGETTAPTILNVGERVTGKGTTPEEILEEKHGETTAPTILSVKERVARKGITPEEILASLLEGESSDEEEERGRKKKKNVVVMSLPAFRGTKEMEEEEEPEKQSEGNMEETENETTSKEEEHVGVVSSDSQSSDSEEEPETAPAQREEFSSTDEDNASSESISENQEEESQPTRASTEPEEGGHPQTTNERRPTAQEEAELQRRANERRLAAVLQRQKETEQNRRLIQGALSNLDGAPGGSAGKHIVFNSDDDEDDEDDENEDEGPKPEQTPEKPSAPQKQAAPRLFDSDEDEDEEEEEQRRFQIRPEFEGEAGLKLMALQSRFGTDERFKMDARFLDDGDEDEERQKDPQKDLLKDPPSAQAETEEQNLLQEKQKNLHILHNLLGTSAPPADKTKTKTFRDVSALHYDPSKEEHAAFEKKTEEKESKASRRKKKEEAEKLPEVSKEIYFEVNTDLKAVFGKNQDQDQEKDLEQERAETKWDQQEEEEEEEVQAEEAQTEQSGGFKFSFFGDDPEPPEPPQTEYSVQSISAPKLSWQQDPRLNDSSSDEEEEEEEAEEEAGDAAAETTVEKPAEETPLTSDLFFFFTNDRRLSDGPRWFCRTSLEEQRETWEETRSQLRQDYKKKHKDARRKLRR